jgi:hypothetical protein
LKNSIDTDVLIIGAGPAGIAAAVGASQSGMKVSVIEKLAYPGGRATASSVGTICGLYFRGKEPDFAMNGFPQDFAKKFIADYRNGPKRFAEDLWFISCPPSNFKSIAHHYLQNKNITSCFNSQITEIDLSQNKIKKVLIHSPNGELNLNIKSLIDCSGDGVSLGLTQHPVLNPDKQIQASAIVFKLTDLSVISEFSLQHILLKNITQQIQNGSIPEHYNLLSIIPFSGNENSFLFKQGIPWNTFEENRDSEKRARELVYEVHHFLKSTISAFDNSKIEWIADELGQRSGIRPLCKETLQEEDILNCSKKATSIAKGVWPVEFWEIGSRKVQMTYFPEAEHYSIPAGCLISGKIENLYFAGKLISSTEKANASSRVIGTCLATGYSAGVLAAYAGKNIPEQEAIKFIQSHLF